MRSDRRPPILLSLYAGLFLVFLYVPILLIPVFAFNDSTIVAFPFRAVTLRWFVELGRNPQLLEALNNSLVVGVVVAILSTAFGTLGAWVLTRYPMKGRGVVTGYIMLPIVAPLVVLAAALFVLVRSAGLELTLFTVGLGHLVLCIPFAFSVMRSRIESFDESLLLASRDLGEGRMGTFLRVVLPISAPGIVSSLLLTFTLSFDEFLECVARCGVDKYRPIKDMGPSDAVKAFMQNILKEVEEEPAVVAATFGLAIAASNSGGDNTPSTPNTR